MPETDIVIAGAGLAGRVAALTLAQQGWHVVLADRRGLERDGGSPAPLDARTTAIMPPGIDLLERTGIWPHVAENSVPLQSLRLIDTAIADEPPVEQSFHATEVGEPWFAQNVPNEHLKDALLEALNHHAHVTLLNGFAIRTVTRDDAHVRVSSGDGRQIKARLLIGADGRDSPSRAAANIPILRSREGEAALVFNVEHERPHENVSLEFHSQRGQTTTIPLPGKRSAINLVGRPDMLKSLLDLGPDALVTHVMAETMERLGGVGAIGAQVFYPIRPFRARRLSANRLVLIGEAAHALAPIGAQGLNTSLADIACLEQLLKGGPEAGDPGRAEITDTYGQRRLPDVVARLTGTNLLSNAVHRLPVPAATIRRLGLRTIGRLAGLRTRLMREGMRPFGT